MKESERVCLYVIGRSALIGWKVLLSYVWAVFQLMGVDSWITVYDTVCYIYIDCVSCELYELPLLSLSHLVPLGVAGKRTKE